MEIRDPIHGSIPILDAEISIIEHPFFQRLRGIKQLGFSEYAFPGATHTRYIHSIGVMSIAGRVFDRIFQEVPFSLERERLKETLKLAGLLHDIGHAPLSHSSESAMPLLSKLKIPERFLSKKSGHDIQATHEHYTIKAIVDGPLTEAFSTVKSQFGVDYNAVAELILGHSPNQDYFQLGGVNYFPLMHQLVSSEIDCDRMDYLLRDSYFCGVSYGKYDLDWIIDNLRPCTTDGMASLAISERAVSTFDDFLLARFHMFLMVYFHYRAVCLEQMLFKYFQTSPGEYQIPANIEQYLEHDDHYLMKILKKSSNEWAKKIVRNSIPQKIFESFGDGNEMKLAPIQNYLEKAGIEYIKCSSQGRLSKYYSEEEESKVKYPIKVIPQYGHKGQLQFKNIDEATDLFDKYSKAHAVTRIHCEWKDLTAKQQEDLIEIIQGPHE